MNDHLRGLAWGSFIGDALAMPVHWYYDRAALHRDYGRVRDYLPPRNPHADSILWRSAYTPLNERGDILREQAQYWGQRGIHYHQFLRAGENTVNLQLAKVLIESLVARGGYDGDDYVRRYLEFMLTPGQHRDTYVEEYHRKFFSAYARGAAPRKCAGSDIHIGGLAHVGVLCAFLAADLRATREAVREHVSLTHRSEEVMSAGDALARMLCAVAAGADLREAIFEHGADWFSKRKAEQWSREPDEIVIGQRVSPACYIADAFPASLYLAWKYSGDFDAGVIVNANVGGDNCHRGAVVGALLGAASGTARMPARFVEGIHDAARLRTQIDSLLTIRQTSLPPEKPGRQNPERIISERKEELKGKAPDQAHGAGTADLHNVLPPVPTLEQWLTNGEVCPQRKMTTKEDPALIASANISDYESEGSVFESRRVQVLCGISLVAAM